MQCELTPAFITSLSALVIAMGQNPAGGAYLVTLTAMAIILNLAAQRGKEAPK